MPPLEGEQPRFAIRINAQEERDFGGRGRLPTYVWNDPLVRDLCSRWLDARVTEAVVLDDEDALVFVGHRERGDGLTEEDAIAATRALEGEKTWVTLPSIVEARHVTLEEAQQAILLAVQRDRENPMNNQPLHRSLGSRSEGNTNRNARTRQLSPRQTESDLESLDDRSTERSFATYSYTTERSSRNSRRSRQANDGRPGRIFIPKFGDDSAGTVSYHAWRSDVMRYVESGRHGDAAIMSELINSLRGPPGEYVRSLPHTPTVRALIRILDDYYGFTLSFDHLYGELFAMHQGSNENVGDFAMRIDTHLNLIEQRCPGRLGTYEQTQETLRERFYERVIAPIRYRLDHKFDTDGRPPTFRELVNLARRAEDRHKMVKAKEKENKNRSAESDAPKGKPRSVFPYNKAKVQVRAATVSESSPTPEPESEPSPSEAQPESQPEVEDDDDAPEIADVLTLTMKAIRREEKRSGRCFNCNEEGHFYRECKIPMGDHLKNGRWGHGQKTGKDRAPVTPNKTQ